MKARTMRVERPGSPSALRWVEVDVPDPGPGLARIRHTAVGFNFIDTYHRSGLYTLPLPTGIGMEGVGIVESVGRGVTQAKPGQRVAWFGGPGTYAEASLVSADALVPVPAGVDDVTAAAVFYKGLTTRALMREVRRLKAGDTVLLHAAAGGIGLVFCQWAASLGVTVIGAVSTEAKARKARANGCAHTIVTTKQDIRARVMKLTGGRGVDVVYDSVGRDTLETSLRCLVPHGLLVSYGSASGKPDPIDLQQLQYYDSPFVTRVRFSSYCRTRDDRLAWAREVFALARKGTIKPNIGRLYSLDDAATAHADAEARRLVGTTVLVP
ncbi:MAG: quinone oxidoreductase [Alphaproteobacteria bacterium]